MSDKLGQRKTRHEALNSPRSSSAEDWPEKGLHALDDACLVQASSKAIFQRGQRYSTSGAVAVTAEDVPPEPALHAQVLGSDTYLTDVWIRNGAIAGRCNCRHAEDGWFCKHQVAVALIWRERLGGRATVTDNATSKQVQASAKRQVTAQDKHQALHDFLHTRDAYTLANKLLELADRDREVSRELQQWRKLSAAADAPDALKPLITDLLAPGREFIAWNEGHSYVRRAEAVLPLLQQARDRDPGEAAKLCLHALRRAWRALMQADDSGGDIGELCEAIRAQWISSLRAAGPQPAVFGATFLQLQLDDPFGRDEATTVKAFIGKAAHERYRRDLAGRWRQANDARLAAKAEQTAQSGGRRALASGQNQIDGDETTFLTLERLHLSQLEQDGDIDGAVALLREDLSHAYAHSRVVEFLERHGRPHEAFAQAKQGIQAFPEDWRLQDDLLRAYERDGRTCDALALRRRQFDAAPDVNRYYLALKAGRADGQDVAALRQALHEVLIARETAASRTPLRGRLMTPPRAASSDTRDVSLRAEILGSEGRWIEACALVQSPALCQRHVLTEIARHLPVDHQEQALALLLRVFHDAICGAVAPYRNELAMVAEISQHMNPAQRSAWLVELRIDYKAKRNFVRDLPST